LIDRIGPRQTSAAFHGVKDEAQRFPLVSEGGEEAVTENPEYTSLVCPNYNERLAAG
jgi:hypothetical protein